jgi:hypothetical protein
LAICHCSDRIEIEELATSGFDAVEDQSTSVSVTIVDAENDRQSQKLGLGTSQLLGALHRCGGATEEITFTLGGPKA